MTWVPVDGTQPSVTLGGDVDVPTLILLGAAGGALRGALDFYIQFANWRSARTAHRLAGQGQGQGQGSRLPAPRFQEYVDPAVDLVAAAVHSVLGAGLAALLGSTGQISGPFAAIVVGISAPVILTQLARVQSVSEAVAGGQGATGGTDIAAPDVQPDVQSDVQSDVRPDVQPDVPAVPAGSAGQPPPNGRPADQAGGPSRGRGMRGTPSLPHGGQVVGEEGTP